MLKIAIIGPESTGKSALAKALAEHYKASLVAEYAREYIENLGKPYTYDDVCTIAKRQIADEILYENGASGNRSFVFFDTDLIITKVWFSFCYQKVPDFVTQRLNSGFIDIYLLCAPDIPWVADPVREHGTDRDFFFNWYRDEIRKLAKPFLVVEGYGNSRTRHAIDFIDKQKNNGDIPADPCQIN